MLNNHFGRRSSGSEEIAVRRIEIARIIFFRLSGQISGERVTQKAWDTMVIGWIENPTLFPLVETCVDAADEILGYLNPTAEPT